MEEEIAGLRIPNPSLLESQNRATENAEMVSLTGANIRSAARLGEMFQVEEEMKKSRQGIGRILIGFEDELVGAQRRM